MAHDVFVSYANHDKPIADAVVAGLESKGLRCWIAPRDIMPGTSWGEAIVSAIEGSRFMVIIMSKNANRSNQVVREVERAVSNNVIIIPFRIEQIDPTGAMAYFLSTEHWLDAITPPLEAHIQKLGNTIQLFQQAGDRPVGQKSTAGPASTQAPVSGMVRRRWPKWLPLAAAGLAAVMLIGLFVLPRLLGKSRETTMTTTTIASTGMATSGSTAASASTGQSTQATTRPPEKPLPVFSKIGEYRTAGSAMALFAADDQTIYLASADGVAKLSVMDPAKPALIAKNAAEKAQDLAVHDPYVYLISGEFEQTLQVFEFGGEGKAASFPGPDDDIGFDASLYHVTVIDGLAHITGHNYWGILDVKSPLEPKLLYSWKPDDNTGNPCKAFIDGKTAYIGAGWAGLFIFDLSDPEKPVLLGKYEPTDWVIDVVVKDQVAYLTLGDSGLLALDVSNPANPMLASMLPLPGFASPIAISGDKAFVLSYLNASNTQFKSGIAAVDISNPAAMTVISTDDKLYMANDLYADGSTIYIADEPLGLTVLQFGTAD